MHSPQMKYFQSLGTRNTHQFFSDDFQKVRTHCSHIRLTQSVKKARTHYFTYIPCWYNLSFSNFIPVTVHKYELILNYNLTVFRKTFKETIARSFLRYVYTQRLIGPIFSFYSMIMTNVVCWWGCEMTFTAYFYKI